MAGLIGSIIGSGQQGSADDQAEAQKQAALAALQNINVPTIQEQQLNLALEKNAGQLSPQQEGTVKLDQNSLNNITNNPELVNAQMQALQSLQQQGTQGLSASDKAALQQITNQQEQTANSQNQGTLQQFAQRGQGGSGANLAAALSNNQNSANNANARALQVAGQAQQNALQATAGAGNLGQSMEAQQYGQEYNKAQAQNAINQFNAQNSQNVMGTNTQAANQAQAFNLNNAQQIANQNTGIQNQQETHNKGLYQTQFGNEFQKATGAANESNSLADTTAKAGANANANTQAIAGQASDTMGSGASLLGGSSGLAAMFAHGGEVTSDKIHPLDKHIVSALLSKLSTNKPQKQLNMAPPMLAPQAPVAPQMPAGPQVQGLARGGIPKPPMPGNSLSMFRMLSGGGQVVPAKVSPGEDYLTPKNVDDVMAGKASPKKVATKVPGKAKVKGDSPKNDTVDAELESGGLVIPRSMVNQSDNVIMDFIKSAKMHAKGSK